MFLWLLSILLIFLYVCLGYRFWLFLSKNFNISETILRQVVGTIAGIIWPVTFVLLFLIDGICAVTQIEKKKI